MGRVSTPKVAYSQGHSKEDQPPTSVPGIINYILRNRKTRKTTKKGTCVWEHKAEAALIRGKTSMPMIKIRDSNLSSTAALAKWRPSSTRKDFEDRRQPLQRFPKRNADLAKAIYEETQVELTAKQVGSRLQQLRDTCGIPKRMFSYDQRRLGFLKIYTVVELINSKEFSDLPEEDNILSSGNTALVFVNQSSNIHPTKNPSGRSRQVIAPQPPPQPFVEHSLPLPGVRSLLLIPLPEMGPTSPPTFNVTFYEEKNSSYVFFYEVFSGKECICSETCSASYLGSPSTNAHTYAGIFMSRLWLELCQDPGMCGISCSICR
jgi:hypothetical protein